MQNYIPFETIESFADTLKTKGKQAATVESYGRDARRFLDYLQKEGITINTLAPQVLTNYQSYLAANQEKENSIRRTVIGIRQFFRFLKDHNVISDTPFDSVPIPERHEELQETLQVDDVNKIRKIAQQNSDPLFATRNDTIICLLAYEGLKVTELIELQWSDYLQGGAHSSLRIGGTRARTIQLGAEAEAAIDLYVDQFVRLKEHPELKKSTEKRMFVAFRGRDASILIPHMTRHGVKFILYELGAQAGLPHLNTERLRHFAVAHLLTKGKSPEDIMQHLGLRRLGNINKHLAELNREASSTVSSQGSSTSQTPAEA